MTTDVSAQVQWPETGDSESGLIGKDSTKEAFLWPCLAGLDSTAIADIAMRQQIALKLPFVYSKRMSSVATLCCFSDADRSALLALKGVGPKVLQRFEEIGISSFAELAKHSPESICEAVATVLGSSCWKNSPASKSAVEAVVALAKSQVG